MITTTQREALAVLAELCDLLPDVRLGQLLAHLGFLGEDQTGRTLWDIDDEQLLAVLYHHRGELVGRSVDSPNSYMASLVKSAHPERAVISGVFVCLFPHGVVW